MTDCKKEYLEYLQSITWKIFRRKIIKEQKNCFVCKGVKVLQVHHLTYKRIYSERNTDVLVLCKSCHSAFHKFTRKINLKAVKKFKQHISCKKQNPIYLVYSELKSSVDQKSFKKGTLEYKMWAAIEKYCN